MSGITEITHNISVLTDTLNSQDGAVPALLGRELTTDVSDVLKNISIVSEELTSITGNADQIVDTALPEVDAILVQLNSMLLDVQDVLEGVKNNPLIRGGVPDRTRGKSSINQLRSEDF